MSSKEGKCASPLLSLVIIYGVSVSPSAVLKNFIMSFSGELATQEILYLGSDDGDDDLSYHYLPTFKQL